MSEINIVKATVPRIDPSYIWNVIDIGNEVLGINKELVARLNKKWDKIVKFELERIAYDAVADFYGDYNPNTYQRKEDLLNAYKVIVTEDDWDIQMGPEFMKYHHNDNEDMREYIYNLSFINGYHGGATGGILHTDKRDIPHPNPPEPWWMKNVGGAWVDWKEPAKQMRSNKSSLSLGPSRPGPYDRIRYEKGEFIEKANKEMTEEYNRLIEPWVKKFVDAINLAYENRAW